VNGIVPGRVRNSGSIPGRDGKFFILSSSPDWLWGPPNLLVWWVREEKWPGREGDNVPQYNAEIKNMWKTASAPSVWLQGLRKDSLIFSTLRINLVRNTEYSNMIWSVSELYFKKFGRHTSTYLLTPWSTVLLEKPTGSQIVKEYPAFYGTRRFITAVTGTHRLSLSWARSIKSIPSNSTSWRFILIRGLEL